jgi:hypothetical protein
MKIRGTHIQILNLLAFVAMVAMNFLAIYLPLNDVLTGDVSKMYPSKLQPVNFVFGIWGVIYFSLFFFSVYQFLLIFLKRDGSLFLITKMKWYFLSSSLLNIIWLILWHHYFIGLSVIVMLMLLINLSIVYSRIYPYRKEASFLDKTLIFFPFSVYLGWIIFAFVLNTSIYAVSVKMSGLIFTRSFWGVIIIIFLGIISAFFVVKRKDIVVGLVHLFAFVGLLLQRLSAGFDSNLFYITAIVFSIWIIGGAIIYDLLVFHAEKKYSGRKFS